MPGLWLQGSEGAGPSGGIGGKRLAGPGIIDRLTATVPDERLRAVFLQSAKAQRVLLLAGG
jgi:hypothetical protein